MRSALFIGGVSTLAAAWLGPLPAAAPRFFSAHMLMHMAVVAIAAPLMAAAIAGGRFDPARRCPLVFSAVPASVLELIVVSVWHAPDFHHVARASHAGLIAEQSMFLAAGLLMWISAFGGAPGLPGRVGSGIVALLLTSMHMTLLGALLALAPRPLYVHMATSSSHDAALAQQQLGGVLMLAIGGTSYLAGGLVLAARLLNARRVRTRGSFLGDLA
jgi:putative membrane protein